MENRGQSRLSGLSPACGAEGGRLGGLRGRLAFAAVVLGVAIHLAVGTAALSAWFQAALSVSVWGITST